MEAHESINLYSRSVITSLGLAYGLANTPFTFTLYTLYNFFITLISQLIEINYTIQRVNITLKLSFNPDSKV